MTLTLVNRNNIDFLRTLNDNSIDSVVTDPPYGISFMNKRWDYDVPTVEFWKEVLRVLKPGGHAAVFCGTKTQHRMAVNIEDAGFEIRDVITWLYGQGFPKSYNIANGIESYILSGSTNTTEFKNLNGTPKEKSFGYPKLTFEQGARPADYSEDGELYKTNIEYTREEAQQWKGWGTALKPACEFITLARKPISEKNIVLNVLKWGTGGINIDASRIELNGEIVPINKLENWSGFGQELRPDYIPTENVQGRWPANLILDEDAGKLLDEQSGFSKSPKTVNKYHTPSGTGRYHLNDKKGSRKSNEIVSGPGDSGGASRFFYCSKPSKKDKGLYNSHPTVKPLSLVKYLVKMITPFKGICVDPYMGSGTTALACAELDVDFIGIELEKEYVEIAEKRLEDLSTEI